ncbi:MAG TPA: DnaB-like helicase C-terminal domain-containing protein [Candidatus Wallbacteria bacterium]|nr:MAG: DNA primase [bacterium ADurb.Bin243]HPG57310.1 DnaB-like helicase C-terminal domain-containing protein [Candidatus Wallbacteria bacterium]
MNRKQLFKNIKNELKSIDIAEVARRLDLFETLHIDEHTLLGNCITRHGSEHGRCFGLKHGGNYFNCFSCGVGGDIFKLVELARNVEFKSAMQWLIENFRPELLSEFDKFDIKPPNCDNGSRYTEAALYEEIVENFKPQLYEQQGREALRYLVEERHYDAEALRRTEWLYFPPTGEIREYLQDRHKNDGDIIKSRIKELHLNGYFGDNFRLAFPYRDRWGRITGFIKRAICSRGADLTTHDGKEHTGVRWDSTSGLEKTDLFNLHNCRRQNSIIVVEGYPDAIYLTACGIPNIVAVGQGNLSEKHLEGIRSYSINRAIICFDNDKPKEDGIITGVANADKAVGLLMEKSDVEVFVIDPRKMRSLSKPERHVKDPDEYFVENGLNALRSFFANEPESAAKWQAKRLAEKHNLTNDIQKSEYWAETAKCYAGINTINFRYGEDFIAATVEASGYSRETVATELETHRERKIVADMNKDIENTLIQGLDDRDIDKIEAGLKEIRAKYSADQVEHSLDYNFDSLLNEALCENITGLKTGFECFDGTEEMEKFRIKEGGVTIVAGNSGVGKTTLMLNIFLNMIEEYPDKTFIFFTLEESAKALQFKMINRKAQITLNQNSNTRAIIKHMKETPREQWNCGIKAAVETLRCQASSNRFKIIDENYDVNDLVAAITRLRQRYNIGAIFIDYIQKLQINSKAVPGQSKSQMSREFATNQLRLQKISEIVRNHTQQMDVAVIMGSQLNKEGQIREAMDIFHDANLVLTISEVTRKELEDLTGRGLYEPRKNKARYIDVNANSGKRTKAKKNPEDDLVVLDRRLLTIEKGRDIGAHEKMLLHFTGHILKLSDRPERGQNADIDVNDLLAIE